MYNVTKPTLDDLPTSKQLLRSTLIALVAAFAILIAIVLPSEYGIDPTGIGRVLGLSEMGEIETQLAEEAAAEAKRKEDERKTKRRRSEDETETKRRRNEDEAKTKRIGSEDETKTKRRPRNEDEAKTKTKRRRNEE